MAQSRATRDPASIATPRRHWGLRRPLSARPPPRTAAPDAVPAETGEAPPPTAGAGEYPGAAAPIGGGPPRPWPAPPAAPPAAARPERGSAHAAAEHPG